MAYEARILADSISPAGHRLTTALLTVPRIVLAEVNTHRMLSKSSASSRAIPVAKKIAQVSSDLFVPEAFGKNQKGMQHGEVLDEYGQEYARTVWNDAAHSAISSAKALSALEVHKQLANRVLEPFAWHTMFLTGTDWSNFFNLRVNPDAQGEFSKGAAMLKEAYDESKPVMKQVGGWHLPLVDKEDVRPGIMLAEQWVKISAARCARVSFLTHEGKRDTDEDLALYERLLKSGHMSPLEHVARPMTSEELHLFALPKKRWNGSRFVIQSGIAPTYCGNLNGWVSLRATIPGEEDILGYRKANP